jgi:hypothetical protein
MQNTSDCVTTLSQVYVYFHFCTKLIPLWLPFYLDPGSWPQGTAELVVLVMTTTPRSCATASENMNLGKRGRDDSGGGGQNEALLE